MASDRPHYAYMAAKVKSYYLIIVV